MLMALCIALVLMAIHYTPMIAAIVKWSSRSIDQNLTSTLADLAGIMGIPAVIYLFFWFAKLGPGGPEGDGPSWLVIMSMLSFGVLPATTIALHFFAGRLIGRVLRALK